MCIDSLWFLTVLSKDDLSPVGALLAEGQELLDVIRTLASSSIPGACDKAPIVARQVVPTTDLRIPARLLDRPLDRQEAGQVRLLCHTLRYRTDEEHIVVFDGTLAMSVPK